jgi:hypothetical protein
MQSVASASPSLALTRCNLYDDVTCTIRTAPPPVLRPARKTLARLVFRWSKPVNLDACPISSSSSRQFHGATDKLYPVWFWYPNHQTVAADYEAQTGKPDPVVLMSNHWQTIDLGFEATPRNQRSSSPCVWYRPHTASPDISFVRPPSTRSMLDHSQSSAPDLLLLSWSSSLPAMSHLSPADHETNKCDSPHETKIKVEPWKLFGFKFKLRQVNYSSQSNQDTDHLVSQSPPWWVHW